MICVQGQHYHLLLSPRGVTFTIGGIFLQNVGNWPPLCFIEFRDLFGARKEPQRISLCNKMKPKAKLYQKFLTCGKQIQIFMKNDNYNKTLFLRKILNNTKVFKDDALQEGTMMFEPQILMILIQCNGLTAKWKIYVILIPTNEIWKKV